MLGVPAGLRGRIAYITQRSCGQRGKHIRAASLRVDGLLLLGE
jgi:hypothetical protein